MSWRLLQRWPRVVVRGGGRSTTKPFVVLAHRDNLETTISWYTITFRLFRRCA